MSDRVVLGGMDISFRNYSSIQLSSHLRWQPLAQRLSSQQRYLQLHTHQLRNTSPTVSSSIHFNIFDPHLYLTPTPNDIDFSTLTISIPTHPQTCYDLDMVVLSYQSSAYPAFPVKQYHMHSSTQHMSYLYLHSSLKYN